MTTKNNLFPHPTGHPIAALLVVLRVNIELLEAIRISPIDGDEVFGNLSKEKLSRSKIKNLSGTLAEKLLIDNVESANSAFIKLLKTKNLAVLGQLPLFTKLTYRVDAMHHLAQIKGDSKC